MKIIEINFYLGGGGASRFMADLSNHFAKDNNMVTAVSICDNQSAHNNYISFREELNPSVKYLSLNQKNGLSWSAIWNIFQLIKKEQPDIVHLHASILLLVLPAIFCKNIHYIHTIHTLVTRQYSSRFIKFVANRLYKSRMVTPITISQECHESYKECFGRQDDILITNGREELNTTKKKELVRVELANLGYNESIPLFLHVARHHPVKNHERLFKTFQRLSNECVDYQLVVIGDQYEEYQDRFKNHKQIHLIGPRTNIGDYMSYADYFVLTSDKEGLPLSLLEAMSMGVIPICTPAGGIKDVLRNGENGFVSQEFSDESYYQAVKHALKESKTLNREKIIAEYKEKYSMEKCANNYMDVYNYMCKSC